MRKFSGQSLFLLAVVAASSLMIGYLVATSDGWAVKAVQPTPGNRTGPDPKRKMAVNQIPFNGAQSYEYLKQICEIGPRYSGSAGMDRQQKLLVEHFKKLGGKVALQEFSVRHPQSGEIAGGRAGDSSAQMTAPVELPYSWSWASRWPL
jgi:hypothetical protein